MKRVLILAVAGAMGAPVTSPPRPRADPFTYTEEWTGWLMLQPPNVLPGTSAADYVGPPVPRLFPEELAQVRFAKATFNTYADWRTHEVPFEFRDLPLPPR